MDYPRVTEAICAACVMRGGQEEPCVNRGTLLKLQAGGRLCPRVELRDDNEVPAQLSWFAAKLGGDHPLWHKLFDLHSEQLDQQSRLNLFFAVIEAVSDEGIAGRIRAARERAAKGDGG